MAAVASSPWMIGVQDHYSLVPKYPFLSSRSLSRRLLRFSSSQQFRQYIRASSSVALEQYLLQEARTESKAGSEVDLFACPVCYDPLVRKGPLGFNLPAIYRSGFKCTTCNKTYSRKNIYLDLTITAGSKDYNEFKPGGTELFRSPVVSFLYERGWRQNFNRRGFPGPDEEAGGNYNHLTEEEIEDLCTSCGLIYYTSKVQQSFIMFSAQKL